MEKIIIALFIIATFKISKQEKLSVESLNNKLIVKKIRLELHMMDLST